MQPHSIQLTTKNTTLSQRKVIKFAESLGIWFDYENRGMVWGTWWIGPLAYAIHRKLPKTINLSDLRPNKDLHGRYLLHEVVHVLVGGDPTKNEEVDGPNLAMEIYFGRRLRLQGMKEFYEDFVLNDKADLWYEVTPMVRARCVAKSLRAAVKLKLLTREGKPGKRLSRQS